MFAMAVIEAAADVARGTIRTRPAERTSAATPAAWAGLLISPFALAAMRPAPGSPDQLAARWLLAVAARLLHDVGDLVAEAAGARRRLATFTIDGEVRFASAADRATFAEDLADAVSTLVASYDDTTAGGGREHRIVVAVHPSIRPTRGTADRNTTED
jgi:hypothetical protein